MADARARRADHAQPGFFTRWFCSVSHEDIGILHLVAAGLLGAAPTAMTGFRRLELVQPGARAC